MQVDDLISPQRVSKLGSRPPGGPGGPGGEDENGGAYNPVEFCLPIGPIFSFVSG